MTDRVEEPEVSRDEGEETAEVVEDAPFERVQLEEATVEPEAVVEREMDVEQAEAVEAAVVEAVDVQAIEESQEGEGGKPVTETERSAEVVGEARLEAVGKTSAEERQTEGEEEIPVVEVVPEAEALSQPPVEETEGEMTGRREGEADQAGEPAEDASSEMQVADTASLSEEDVEDVSVGDTGVAVQEEPTEETGSILTEEVASETEGEAFIETLNTEAEHVQEVKEYWEPPEMYVYEAPDGTTVLVNADGNSIDSPPQLSGGPREDDTSPYLGWYPGMDKSEQFEVKTYAPPIKDMYVYVGQDGTLKVVDKDGTLIPHPPNLGGDLKGQVDPKITAWYGKAGSEDSKVVLSFYTPSLSDIYAYHAPDGSISIVDLYGKMVETPPYHVSKPGDDGSTKVLAWVPGKASGEDMIELKAYEPPLLGMSVYLSEDGSITVVYNDGTSLESPPHVTKVEDEQGLVNYYATAPGVEGEGAQVKLYQYIPSLRLLPNPVSLKEWSKIEGSGVYDEVILKHEEMYAYDAGDGTFTVVDKNGKPLNSPPHLQVVGTEAEMMVDITASYPGYEGWTEKLQLYNASSFYEENPPYFIHAGQDGSMSVVDANGKPIDSPPTVQKVSYKDGVAQYFAHYPGSTESPKFVELQLYKPASAHLK